ncbi:hypothetical protein VP01_230g5 [Puccinia sorghi]|uniref:Uncharacterized protein n=1 Tax=Puccinia sorghi TaxID=27349 RepID=A0A0L6V8F5_9BASI|nr:hypothetical protein VP01_230g5 [Puccinia sorghi]
MKERRWIFIILNSGSIWIKRRLGCCSGREGQDVDYLGRRGLTRYHFLRIYCASHIGDDSHLSLSISSRNGSANSDGKSGGSSYTDEISKTAALAFFQASDARCCWEVIPTDCRYRHPSIPVDSLVARLSDGVFQICMSIPFTPQTWWRGSLVSSDLVDLPTAGFLALVGKFHYFSGPLRCPRKRIGQAEIIVNAQSFPDDAALAREKGILNWRDWWYASALLILPQERSAPASGLYDLPANFRAQVLTATFSRLMRHLSSRLRKVCLILCILIITYCVRRLINTLIDDKNRGCCFLLPLCWCVLRLSHNPSSLYLPQSSPALALTSRSVGRSEFALRLVEFVNFKLYLSFLYSSRSPLLSLPSIDLLVNTFRKRRVTACFSQAHIFKQTFIPRFLSVRTFSFLFFHLR